MVMRPPLVNVMARAAEKAAKGLKRDFGEVEHLQISRKGPGDFVSSADLNAQNIIREELSKARPDFGFLMEEKDDNPDTSGKSERWIVDPLDGTSNFLHGMPHWCISIAAEKEGEVVSGLIYDPVKDEMFWAEKGVGAYLNSRRLRVSARNDFSECLIATGLPFRGSSNPVEKSVKDLIAVMPMVAGIRRAGSAALDMAYVAAGRFDGYWESFIHPWDIAAGIIMVKEAGGFVGAISKGKNPLSARSIVAANSAIYEKLYGLVSE